MCRRVRLVQAISTQLGSLKSAQFGSTVGSTDRNVATPARNTRQSRALWPKRALRAYQFRDAGRSADGSGRACAADDSPVCNVVAAVAASGCGAGDPAYTKGVGVGGGSRRHPARAYPVHLAVYSSTPTPRCSTPTPGRASDTHPGMPSGTAAVLTHPPVRRASVSGA
jgi:hypothetical protein